MMVGRNFLAWHRQYLFRLEQRLQMADSSVSIPYWDWMVDREIPGSLSRPALLRDWGITRRWDAGKLPMQADIDAVNAQGVFESFQPRLEYVHGFVHNAVGGTMSGSSSPADPLFWLHHANIDRLWSVWEKAHPRAIPPNVSETLKPAPLFGIKVSAVLDINALGYGYE
jgi:tyrosinase